jgi:hemerythrin superfamily protein
MNATNAIDLLRSDHLKVRELLAELATPRTAVPRRAELVGLIKRELLVHATLEEEIFYPVFRESGDGEHERLFHEAHEAHRAIEKLILPDLEATDAARDEFRGRAKVLCELIERHTEEEEREIFPRATQALTDAELERVGLRIERRKLELIELL